MACYEKSFVPFFSVCILGQLEKQTIKNFRMVCFELPKVIQELQIRVAECSVGHIVYKL